MLGLTEAPHHPHLAARGTFTEREGHPEPAPAPRISRTPGAVRGAPSGPGQDTRAALAAWGFDDDELAGLLASGAVVQADGEEQR